MTSDRRLEKVSIALEKARTLTSAAMERFLVGDLEDAEKLSADAADEAASAYGWLHDMRRGRPDEADE